MSGESNFEGLSAEETFSLLGSEIRLDIVRVLWGATGGDLPTESDGCLSFSELQRRVGVENTGQFNYHLSQLVPHFVREAEEGYRLSRPGKQIARAVVAVSDDPPEEFPTELEATCPFCQATLQAAYKEQQLHVKCENCSGVFGDEAPSGEYSAGFPASTMLPGAFDGGISDGTITVLDSPPTGLDSADPDEWFEQSLYRCHLDITYMMHGLCRACAGPTAGSTIVCEDHDPEGGICDDCGSPFEVWGELECATCGLAKRLPVELFTTGLAPVIGFLYDHGVNPLEPSFEEMTACMETMFDVTVETPSRIRVSIVGDDSSVSVTLADDLSVVAVET